MKRFFRVFVLCMAACACVEAGAQESGKQKLSVSMDYWNSGESLSLNAEWSPNKYVDLGMGYTPFALFIIPAQEVHFFARACFLDYFIQPYVQLGVSFVAPGQINDNTEWCNARVGAGAKFTFGEHWYCGVGGGWCFVGQSLIPTSDFYGMDWHGFYPALFVGYTVTRF